MNQEENKNPGIPPEKLNYFQVFSYFENRGAQVKNMMFSIITWLIGFVTVILGFSIKECIELSAISVSKPIPLMAFSTIGIFIIIYAVIVIYDFGGHINRNFERADLARKAENDLNYIWYIGDEAIKTGLPKICKILLVVIFVFGLFCLALFIWGLLTWINM